MGSVLFVAVLKFYDNASTKVVHLGRMKITES